MRKQAAWLRVLSLGKAEVGDQNGASSFNVDICVLLGVSNHWGKAVQSHKCVPALATRADIHKTSDTNHFGSAGYLQVALAFKKNLNPIL